MLATDVDGIAEFYLIYPSVEDSSAIHIHYKVRIGNRAFVIAQWLYPKEINPQVSALAPCNTARGTKPILIANDARVIVEPVMFLIVERAGRLSDPIKLFAQT